jgi:hypothetical protein
VGTPAFGCQEFVAWFWQARSVQCPTPGSRTFFQRFGTFVSTHSPEELRNSVFFTDNVQRWLEHLAPDEKRCLLLENVLAAIPVQAAAETRWGKFFGVVVEVLFPQLLPGGNARCRSILPANASATFAGTVKPATV